MTEIITSVNVKSLQMLPCMYAHPYFLSLSLSLPLFSLSRAFSLSHSHARTCMHACTHFFVYNPLQIWISNGQLADAVVVVAKTKQSSRAAHSLSLLIVERGMPGFERGKNLEKIGMKAQVCGT